MREYTQVIRDDLKIGLRRDYRARTGLESCINLKATEYGLAPYIEVELPFSIVTLDAHVVDLSWPFPQLLRGREVTLLADTQRIFFVNEADWSLLLLDLFQAKADTAAGSITVGNAWQMVDFGTTWFLHNGKSTVFHTDKYEALGQTDKVLVANHIPIQAGCAFKGRAFFGGFELNEFWDDNWLSFYEDWSTRKATGLDHKRWVEGNEINQPMRPNMVFWSSIGGGDITALLMNASNAFTGFISGTGYNQAAKPLIFDYLRRNEWGFMPMPWQGRVRTIKPLGEPVIVYGDNGISALTMHGTLVGLKNISSIGIASVGAVAGDLATERNLKREVNHIFIDGEGVLWSLGADLNPERLGYKEFFAPMLGTDIMISHDASENEFYISNGYRSFILTKAGLTEYKQPITSGYRIRDNFYGLGVHKDAMERTWSLKTSEVEGSRGLKQCSQVDAMITTDPFGGDTIHGAVESRYEVAGQYEAAERIELSEDGVFYPQLTGNGFKVVLDGTEFKDVDIEHIRVHLKYIDRRHRRAAEPLSAGIEAGG